MNVILGNGMSSFVIASCLKYLQQDCVIYKNRDVAVYPEIMLLEYKNNDELELYKKIFDIENVDKYLVDVKVGYYYNNKINDTLTGEAKRIYLEKQNRKNTTSSISDSKNLFKALKLNEIFNDNYTNFEYKPISNYVKDDSIIYDTMDYYSININGECHYEYLSHNDMFDIQDYNYVYDCTDSKIKRYTKNSIEYIAKPDDRNFITISNYYDEPKFYKRDNITLIGRYSTKTQMKQYDIINYLINKKGLVYEI